MAAAGSDKPLVAVDLDEVLGTFVRSLNKFHNARYGTMYREADYFSYHFSNVWGCSEEEASERVQAFFASDEFAAIGVVPGAGETLSQLSAKFRFAVVTSRQNAVQDATRAWLEKNFPGMFESVHFANHYAADGSAPRSKSDICTELGAVALIDDSRHHALECATKGLPCVILFGEYSWNRPSIAGAAESAGAAMAAVPSLSSSMENVHPCSEWRHVKTALDRLTRTGTMAPMASLWVRGGMEEVSTLRQRAEKTLLKQDELAVTAVGVSITTLLAVVAGLCDAGVAESARTVSGLDVGRSATAGRMPRLTVTLRRTPKLMEEAEARERAMAEQADALAEAMMEHAAKASAAKASAAAAPAEAPSAEA